MIDSKKSRLKCLFSFPLFLLALASACSSAPKTPVTATPVAPTAHANLPHWATPHYLTEIPFSLDAVMRPPYAENSEESRKEYAAILQWQKTRTAAQCEAARLQQIPTLEQVFGASRGKSDLPDFKKLNPEAVGKLKIFFDRYQRDVSYVSHEAKRRWARNRPYIARPEIHPCVKREITPAYPSGHAAFGAAGAEILSEIFPKYSAGFEKSGKAVGMNRIISGVHHPSDVESGFELGHKTVEALRKLPKFEADLGEIKALFAKPLSRPSGP
jgi:acid phosphatase (class A)